MKDPEYALFALFEHAIFEAIKDSKEQGFNPENICLTILSVNLVHDINTGFSKITENTVSSIYNYFLYIEQSRVRKNLSLALLAALK